MSVNITAIWAVFNFASCIAAHTNVNVSDVVWVANDY